MSLRVFLTGATGYVGSAVLDAALKAGHQVAAIARDREKVERLNARGATGILAELGTPKRYVETAASADVVIHTALESSSRGPQIEREFLDLMLPALGSAARPAAFIYTSGTWTLGDCPTPADESVVVRPAEISTWRVPHEALVLGAASANLRVAVVRPGNVYGGGRGMVSDLLKNALNGLIRVVGTGKNHWPAIYDRDLGDLYVRVAQTPDASGVFHVNDEADERVGDVVEAIAEHLSQRPDIRYVPIEEARAKLGPYADALALDQKVRSPRARQLGWTPSLRSISGNVARLFEEYRNAHQS